MVMQKQRIKCAEIGSQISFKIYSNHNFNKNVLNARKKVIFLENISEKKVSKRT
jgi:hypothetical protein